MEWINLIELTFQKKLLNNSHKIFNEIDTLKSWTKFCIFANGIVHGEEDIFEYNKSNIVDKEFEDIYINTLEEVDNNNNLINTIPKTNTFYILWINQNLNLFIILLLKLLIQIIRIIK